MYITLQAQVYIFFQTELLLTFIKISKDLIFYYSFFILVFGSKESILTKKILFFFSR